MKSKKTVARVKHIKKFKNDLWLKMFTTIRAFDC